MEYAPPPPELVDQISALYSLRQNQLHVEEIERADRAQLRVWIQGRGEYHFPDGHVGAVFPVTIFGPTSGVIHGVGYGPLHVVGVGLQPAAWGTLMGPDAALWADRTIDATTIFGDSATELHRAISASDNTQQHFTLLCDFITTAITAMNETAPTAFISIMEEWLIERVDPKVDVLVERLGLGMRQIERLSKRYYGLPPKTLARKYRALRVAAAMARGDDLNELGLGDTFYDQSHLIRELKRFAGLTPQQIAQHQSSLLVEVAQGLKGLEGQVSAIVSGA